MRDKKSINKWSEIKRTLRSRPFLIYQVGIPLNQWNVFNTKTPTDEEIERIQEIIINDRTEKTLRLKTELTKIVGYRELANYAKQSMTSTTTIKDIIEGKKTAAGYEVINKLEIFINAINSEFEISIENTLTAKSFVNDEFRDLSIEVERSISILREFTNYLFRIGKDLQNETRYYPGGKINPTDMISRSIEILNDVKPKIEILNELYLDKK